MFVIIRVIGVLLVLAVVWWAATSIVAEVRYRRTSRALALTRDVRGRPMMPPHQRVTDAELEAKARQLRRAVAANHVTLDEAVGSLVRYGGAAVSPDRARQLLG